MKPTFRGLGQSRKITDPVKGSEAPNECLYEPVPGESPTPFAGNEPGWQGMPDPGEQRSSAGPVAGRTAGRASK